MVNVLSLIFCSKKDSTDETLFMQFKQFSLYKSKPSYILNTRHFQLNYVIVN